METVERVYPYRITTSRGFRSGYTTQNFFQYNITNLARANFLFENHVTFFQAKDLHIIKQ